MARNYRFSKELVAVPLVLMVILFTTPASSVTHIVGNNIWTIPPANNFYNDWSYNQTFHAGDYLYFEFESEMYNVVQVAVDEFRDCVVSKFSAESTTGKFTEGPALVSIYAPESWYFVCDILDYCKLGVKIHVRVER